MLKSLLFPPYLFCCLLAFAQPKTDKELVNILAVNNDTVLQTVLQFPDSFRLQIIYVQVNRDKNNVPHFKNLYFNYDPGLYFNPASMVKLPLAVLSLEKINSLAKFGVDKFTTIVFDSSKPWQTAFAKDTTAANQLPSVAHLVKRALLISENDPYNRLYQFIGQQEINKILHNKGYADVQISRQFLGLTPEQNRHTNAISFLDKKGKLLYHQPPMYNTDTFNMSEKISLGKAHYDGSDSLINAPFDFTSHNRFSLFSLQRLLQSLIFPHSVPRRKRFNLSQDDHAFLYRYLSQYPSETPYPKYDTSKFYDCYVKFFFRNNNRRLPPNIRVFNKVGWSYGFMTDVSYVADFENKVEFMLAATLYVNSDEIINDGKYEYNTIGYPFLYQLGQTIYQYELKRIRKHKPDLSDFKMQYEKRDPNDERPSLKEVDN